MKTLHHSPEILPVSRPVRLGSRAGAVVPSTIASGGLPVTAGFPSPPPKPFAVNAGFSERGRR